jgi:ABC-type multidrug transport system ATPase subunit
MSTNDIIQLNNISKTYPRGIAALSKLNLTVSKQEIVGIIGANGSGKSTLVKIIAGKLKHEQGVVNIFQKNTNQYSQQLKNRISYISQDRALDPEMKGIESMLYFAALYGLSRKQAGIRVCELSDTFDLTEFITRRISTYSGGQAQRLHLAIGVLHNPELLLLDEPDSALDPAGKKVLWQFIKTYQQQGNTIIIVSHDLATISKHCSHVVLLNNGSLIANSTVEVTVQSHSHLALQLKTAENITNLEKLTKTLLDQFKTNNIQVLEGSRKFITLEFISLQSSDKPAVLYQILKIFADQQQTVIECHWDEPSLAQAYFKLTGKMISPLKTTLQKNKRRKRH